MVVSSANNFKRLTACEVISPVIYDLVALRLECASAFALCPTPSISTRIGTPNP